MTADDIKDQELNTQVLIWAKLQKFNDTFV